MISTTDLSTLHQARVILAAHGFADDARNMGRVIDAVEQANEDERVDPDPQLPDRRFAATTSVDGIPKDGGVVMTRGTWDEAARIAARADGRLHNNAVFVTLRQREPYETRRYRVTTVGSHEEAQFIGLG